MKKNTGTELLRFCIPVIDVLKDIGGSGTPSEVTNLVIEKLNIPEKELEETIKNGQSKIRTRIAWARFYLAKTGLIDSSKRGVWILTAKGLNSNLNEQDVRTLFREVQGRFQEPGKPQKEKEVSEAGEIKEETEPEDYKSELLSILQSLSPDGFERICQLLLREAGFQQVNVTGRPSDGGIDGDGILEVNPFVSFKVLFQCKRYKGSVSPSQVRDFRGAMQGRADKGIIITTGMFSRDAKKESERDGAPPIQLVDGEKLVEMFENQGLGLEKITKEIVEVKINYEFFKDFQK